MYAEDKNRLTMARVVSQMLGEDKWKTVVLAVPALSADKLLLDTKIARLDIIAPRQGLTTKGVTKGKTKTRDTLTACTRVVAGGIRRWARSVNNLDIVAQATITYSQMTYNRGEQAVKIATGILKLGNDNAAALVAFNVDAAKLTALSNALDAFKTQMVAPRNVVVDSKESTAEVEAVMGDIMITLTDLDDVVETVHVTNTDFFLAYKAARIIIDLPGGHASPQPPAGPTPPTP